MLDHAVTLLKSGGRLVYCTCSLEPEEGELQIEAFLKRHPQMKRVPVTPEELGQMAECLTPEGDVRTLPCHLQGAEARQSGLDGFFAARLVKT